MRKKKCKKKKKNVKKKKKNYESKHLARQKVEGDC